MAKMNVKMNLNNKIVNVTRKTTNELSKSLRTVRSRTKERALATWIPAVITEELTHEFKRLWIYKRLHIRIG